MILTTNLLRKPTSSHSKQTRNRPLMLNSMSRTSGTNPPLSTNNLSKKLSSKTTISTNQIKKMISRFLSLTTTMANKVNSLKSKRKSLPPLQLLSIVNSSRFLDSNRPVKCSLNSRWHQKIMTSLLKQIRV